MKRAVIFCCALSALLAQESQVAADFRHEGDDFKASCSGFSFSGIGSCAQVLFTDHPMHIAVGSLAPGNGFGAGAAFVGHWTPNESWRLSFDADAVGSFNGSWRAGAYMTAVYTKKRGIVPKPGGTGTVTVQEYPAFHLYAESTSLNQLTYFGLGPNTATTARSYYGERETVIGANVVYPLIPKLKLSLYGEMNGRFVELRPRDGQSSPSIEQIYTEATAPGLRSQPGFAQFGEGIRLRPTLAGGYVRLNYSVNFQQYVAGDSVYSFRRFTTDFTHEFPLYRRTRSYLPQDHNGPDDCAAGAGEAKCPQVTRNLEGSVQVRFLLGESFLPSGNAVPFYFDPTLGGSDINGGMLLGSYADYRFRAPNYLLARASFEHSIYGPLGVSAMIDEGKVALTHSDVDFSHLAHSYAAGLTLRAGGFPMVYLMFAWGGHTGTHSIVNVNTSLLGGADRPSLF